MNTYIKNITRSSLMGICNNILNAVLNFICRKLFLSYIGIEYLSVSQVITTILYVMSFTELGISNAVLSMLYDPVARNDRDAINRLLSMYKKFNRMVGIAILILGLAFTPFLNYIITTGIPYESVVFIYLLNVFYTSSTYFCSHRFIMLNANQKDYIFSGITMVFSLLRLLLQCIAIVSIQKYSIYLGIQIIIGVAQNVFVYVKVGRLYPYIKERRQNMSEIAEEKGKLIQNIKAMFSIKVAGIVINNTDGILVSVINTIMVGFCANYTNISQQIKNVLSVVHHALLHSMGIASVGKSAEEQYTMFKKSVLFNTFFVSGCTVVLGIAWNDAIVLWLGADYLLEPCIFWSLLLNFAYSQLGAPVWIMRDSNGLFIYEKKALLIDSLFNIIISILLGKLVGISGVYFATIIADLLTDFWYGSNLIYQKLFKKVNALKYQIYIIANLLIDCFFIKVFEQCTHGFAVTLINLALKIMAAAIVYIMLFILIHRNNGEFKGICQNIIHSVREKFSL